MVQRVPKLSAPDPSGQGDQYRWDDQARLTHIDRMIEFSHVIVCPFCYFTLNCLKVDSVQGQTLVCCMEHVFCLGIAFKAWYTVFAHAQQSELRKMVSKCIRNHFLGIYMVEKLSVPGCLHYSLT